MEFRRRRELAATKYGNNTAQRGFSRFALVDSEKPSFVEEFQSFRAIDRKHNSTALNWACSGVLTSETFQAGADEAAKLALSLIDGEP